MTVREPCLAWAFFFHRLLTSAAQATGHSASRPTPHALRSLGPPSLPSPSRFQHSSPGRRSICYDMLRFPVLAEI